MVNSESDPYEDRTKSIEEMEKIIKQEKRSIAEKKHTLELAEKHLARLRREVGFVLCIAIKVEGKLVDVFVGDDGSSVASGWEAKIFRTRKAAKDIRRGMTRSARILPVSIFQPEIGDSKEMRGPGPEKPPEEKKPAPFPVKVSVSPLSVNSLMIEGPFTAKQAEAIRDAWTKVNAL